MSTLTPTTRPAIRHLPFALTCAAALALSACASNTPATADAAAAPAESSAESTSADAAPAPALTIPAAQYAAAFDSAKHALRDMGFLLERVDAQAGVITTQPKGTAGLATPWDREQSGIDQEFDDLFHRQQRVARVEFTPVGSALASNDDLRAFTGDIEARVQVAVLRAYQPGRRVNTGNITSSTYTTDPQLDAQGLTSYTVAQKQDSRLAQRVLRAIEGNLSAAASQDSR